MQVHKESLMHKIKRLYTELFLVSLHNRIDSYHSFLNTDKYLEISKQLHKLIDEIIQDASHQYSIKDYQQNAASGDGNAKNELMVNKIQSHSTNMASMTLNGLSVFLQKQQAKEHNSDMSERLQRCVWDHVHSAHRFARLGDGNTAKLHADIATNAIKTLSHYMPEDDYHLFFDEINEQLQLTSSTKN